MRLWWSIRKRLARLDRRPRVVERLGARWALDPNDWLDLRLLAGQPFEAEQRARFADAVARARPARLYDIGANFGLYSVTLGLAHPDLPIEAFEPVSTTRAKLEGNLALNGLAERVRVHPLALSDAEGEAEIAIDPRSSGLSTLSASADEAARRDFARAETIRTARLDDLAAPEGETLAFKIDVEGHEVAALRGMARILAANRGVMMIETRARNAPEVLALLTKAGWRETGRVQEEIFLEKP
ncbi:FkbM family methyltransferase [Albimonas sp. CAU 1670]|uniref:FkbM family methyltransferase n=1 Tax=Albimonas sp. CAU 1670 TaxID=3032599 RepID=UPI0023DB67C6|nr:FkbM family methyltransferase [Albimonas sp. CAU 1670]MDF2234540.1 FkbM family methyltransferase [Albimonas sp. CAU 1670]